MLLVVTSEHLVRCLEEPSNKVLSSPFVKNIIRRQRYYAVVFKFSRHLPSVVGGVIDDVKQDVPDAVFIRIAFAGPIGNNFLHVSAVKYCQGFPVIGAENFF